MHTTALSVNPNSPKLIETQTADPELTENKRMENANTPMSARIVAKTSRPSGPPSAISKILRNPTKPNSHPRKPSDPHPARRRESPPGSPAAPRTPKEKPKRSEKRSLEAPSWDSRRDLSLCVQGLLQRGAAATLRERRGDGGGVREAHTMSDTLL
jgi:hypothetical protein